MRKNSIFLMLIVVFFIVGCQTTGGNSGQLQTFLFNVSEAEWIRNGEPVDFEGFLWYPADSTEWLMDNEVFLVGEYRGVQFFVEKIDVRPYNRLYTKFGVNKFRYFERAK